MFVAQAHSFRQQARLAITLSWIAGYTNILTILTYGQVTSHVTGTASQLGRDVADGRWREGAYMASLLVVFVSGAGLSGFLTELGRRRHWASIYVLPMAVEAVLLAAFAVLVDWNAIGALGGESAHLWLTFLPALAMGLQNATITRISGGTVRTTHVSGVMTDLGLESVVWAMRRLGGTAPVSAQGTFATGWRLVLLASIVGSFVLGAGLGAFAFGHLTEWSVAPAVVFLAWIVAMDFWNPIASARSNKDVGGDLHGALPAGVSVFHLSSKSTRFGRRARLPNLTLWTEDLDPVVRVVVLDVSEVEFLDANALIELRAIALRLATQDRALVLAGVTPQRFIKLRDAGVLQTVTAANVYSDLDLAAAHAMSLLDRQEHGESDGR
jgi:uncharacterized membrane protein YoaK (UPF0700 family)